MRIKEISTDIRDWFLIKVALRARLLFVKDKKERKQIIISWCMNTVKGREMLGKAMVEPIIRVLGMSKRTEIINEDFIDSIVEQMQKRYSMPPIVEKKLDS